MAAARSTSRIGRIGARQEALAGYGLIAIPMAIFLVLNIGSFLYAAYISVWRWHIRRGPLEFVGLDNFQRVLGDTTFQIAIRNSIYYAVIWVPLTMAIGLFLAVIVNQKIRGRTFFRAAYYFPALASSAAITMVWIFLMAPDGLFNQVRGGLGINPLFQLFGYGPNQNWIGDYRTAMNTVIVLNAWTTSGTFMLFYLASLQAISKDVYEAAAIDGAGAWDTFRRITFPLLRPAHFFVATVGVIGALQMFDQAIFAGGPNGDPANSLMTVVVYLYNAMFIQISPGYAAAIGVVLFAVIMAATLVQRRLFGQAPAW